MEDRGYIGYILVYRRGSRVRRIIEAKRYTMSRTSATSPSSGFFYIDPLYNKGLVAVFFLPKPPLGYFHGRNKAKIGIYNI